MFVGISFSDRVMMGADAASGGSTLNPQLNIEQGTKNRECRISLLGLSFRQPTTIDFSILPSANEIWNEEMFNNQFSIINIQRKTPTQPTFGTS